MGVLKETFYGLFFGMHIMIFICVLSDWSCMEAGFLALDHVPLIRFDHKFDQPTTLCQVL